MSLIKQWKERGELPADYPEPPSRLQRLREKASRAKAALDRRREEAEEKSVRRAELKAESRAARARREVGLSSRLQAASTRKREAEIGLEAQRGREVTALVESREARRKRILADRRLRSERVRPLTEAGARVARAGRTLGRGVVGVAKVPFALGERLTRPTTPSRVVRRKPKEEPLGEELDFGFEDKPKTSRRVHREGLDMDIFPE